MSSLYLAVGLEFKFNIYLVPYYPNASLHFVIACGKGRNVRESTGSTSSFYTDEYKI